MSLSSVATVEIIPVQAAGVSASGTPGTVIAEVEQPGGGMVLVGISALAGYTGTTTHVSIVLTYTDDTTDSITPSASATFVVCNRSGCVTDLGGQNTFSDLVKPVKKVQVVTAGTGTGNRRAQLAAWAVAA